MLTEACRYTFNAITVDGEPSTNDCVFALASGASGVAIDDATEPALFEGFRTVARELALGIVRGGEGATKLVAITASDAATDADAWMAARAMANSLLVKTAIHGADPELGPAGRRGRTLRGGVRARPGAGPHRLAGALRRRAGRSTIWRRRPPSYLQGTDLDIEVELGTGGGCTATVWTCDLSKEYVRINAEYRT